MNKTVLAFGALIVVIIGLLVWARSNSEPREATTSLNWPGTEIACLVLGHQNLALHIHPILTISVNGQNEPIPADIGVTQDCMSEVHTHDETGTLHIESVVRGKTFKMADFFAVWGRGLEREGYTHQLFVNNLAADTDIYTFNDGDKVELQYISEVSMPAVRIEDESGSTTETIMPVVTTE